MADKRVTQAVERLKLAAEAEKKQREREKDALAFQVPELQWPEEAKQARAGSVVGNITLPARPMLSIPKLDQPVQLILNQEKAAHLGVNVHALSEDADDDTAEIFQGLYRGIERESRANLARSWAFERAVKAGRGAYRILTEPDENYAETKDQRIVFKRLLFQDSVYFDPFATEPDWSDGEWAFVVSWVSWTKYKRLYAKKKDAEGNDEAWSELAAYDDGELLGLIEDCPEWIKGDGESRAVLVAEYFCVEGDGDARKIIWRKMNGIEVLEEKKLDGKYIPLIPTIGRELVPFDNERRWVGVYEPNKDGQRLFNYAASTAVEAAAMEPKAPWILAEGQEEGHEQEFLLANARNFPYIRYKPKMVGGEQAPPPQRSQTDTGKLGLSIQMLGMAGDFLHAGTGAFEPTLGQNSPNVRTKGQTLALQQQHEEGNSNWIDNLVEISMTYEAKVVLDLIPHVYDRPGRVARILDIEDKASMVMLNAPFVPGKGTKRPTAVQQTPDGQQMLPPDVKPDQVKHYDLKKGIYGVSVSVGKGYKSRLEEGNDALGQLFQAEPALFGTLGDIWLEFQSWPGHKQAAERIKKMLPPPLQDHDEQNAEMELQQAKAALQGMQQQMQEMQKALETDKVKVEGDIEKTRIKASADLELQKMRDATSIAVAQINAAAKGVLLATEAENEAQATGRQHAFDATEAAKERAHQVGIAAQGAQQAQQQAAQQTGDAAALAEQGHGHAMARGDQSAASQADLAAQGHQHALEQGQQAADLAPEPEAGE